MTYKVLVTCKQMQESLHELLTEKPMPDFSFTTPELTKQGFTSSEMAEMMKGHDAAIVGDDVVDEPVLSVPGLRFVCKWGVGVDGIDFKAAEKMGIQVTNTPGLFGDDVADLAVSYLVGLTRETFRIHDAVKNGSWPKIRGKSLGNMHVALYGFGSIGNAVARRLILSGCKVTAFDISRDFDDEAEKLGVRPRSSLSEAAKDADALIICCPLTESTRGSVNQYLLDQMAEGGFLVNVARGEIVVEAELVRALDEGQISSAALDVFESEPLSKDSPLIGREVVFGSHNASNCDRSVSAASAMALSNLFSYFSRP